MEGVEDARSLLADRLRLRAPAIREEILDRLHSMEEKSTRRTANYLRGLREAVAGGVDYGIDLLALGEDHVRVAPQPLVGQARRAARENIRLDVVLRRYLAGKTLLSRFLLEEAAHIGLQDPVLFHSMLAVHEHAFDRILTMVTEEYQREACNTAPSHDARLSQRVKRLLGGEHVDPSPLNYDLENHHLGLVALGPEVRPLLRQMGKEAGGRVLAVGISSRETWAWLGTAQPLDCRKISGWAEQNWPDSVPLGIGEPTRGVGGWRKTHAQAKAAAGIATATKSVAKYKDVALVASVSGDPLLLASIGDMYLRPLGPAGKQREVLSRTLLAYFTFHRNSSAAAAALGVTRQTVASRLKTAEERLDEALGECGDLLHAALRLEALGYLATS